MVGVDGRRTLTGRLFTDHLSETGLCPVRAQAEGSEIMKRVKAACLMQTLVFSQKPDCGLTRERQLEVNHHEVARYKSSLEKTHTRYQITEETEQPDGSVLVRVRKQYSDKADVSEYFC